MTLFVISVLVVVANERSTDAATAFFARSVEWFLQTSETISGPASSGQILTQWMLRRTD